MREKPILLVDFDGVLHSYASGWKGADVVSDPPVPGAVQFLWDASEHFVVAIYSARSSQDGGIEAMKAAIDRWDDDHHRLYPNQRVKLSSVLEFPTQKPPAFLTIDDRCLQFTGIFPCMEQLTTFRPWNKRDV